MEYASRLDDAIDLFFRAPEIIPPTEGWVSTLYLCRRELQDCLIGQIVPESELLTHEHHRLFASLMVAFAGLELLARFLPQSSPASRNSATGRFVRLLLEHSLKPTGEPMTQEEAVTLYSFRNALSHSFGVYHIDDNGTASPRFIYDQNAPTLLLGRRESGWELNVDSLVELFLITVRIYREHLMTDSGLQPAFLSAYDRYGLLHLRGPHIAPRASI